MSAGLLSIIPSVLAVTAFSWGAMAQPPGNEHARALHMAARNQLGVLEYCHMLGMVGADAVDAQRSAVARLPPSADTAAGEMEETEGRLGYLAFERRQATFAESAMAQGTNLRLACLGRAADATSAAGR